VSQLAGIFESDPTDVALAKLRETTASLLPEAEAEEVGAHLRSFSGSRTRAPRQAAPVLLVRRFVETVADDRPAAFVFEDIHWRSPRCWSSSDRSPRD
jgi:hypothetical protein